MHSALADLVLVVHFAFVLFVVFGGLLALRWPRVAWAHIPAVAWGVAIELGGWICPLTPVENRLRVLAGEETYRGDFMARCVMPVLYPEGLTREAQVALALAAFALNVAIYLVIARPRWRERTVNRT